MNISEAGKMLSANMQRTAQTQEADRAKLTKILTEDERKTDKAMKKAQDILENMQKLAVLAQDKSLGDLDRIELQIEIEDLKDNLVMIPDMLLDDMNNNKLVSKPANLKQQELQDWASPDGSAILQRARDRVMNGGKWNVREVWRSDTEIFVSHDEYGGEVWEVKTPGWYVLDDDQNVITRDPDGQYAQTSRKVKTVRERLEWFTPYVVMDSESAEKSADLIQTQIDFIRKWRDEMPARIQDVKNDEKARAGIMQEAFSYLYELAYPGGKQNPSVNAPDSPEAYISGYKVYDRNYFGGVMHKYDENGNEIPFEPDIETDTGKPQEEEGEFYAETKKLVSKNF